MKNFKYEIILPYYRRPKVVLNALESIKKLEYDNWHLTFIDDSGDESFRETLLSFGLPSKKVTYIATLMSDDDKKKFGGSVFGKYMNECIKSSTADILIVLCDDDALRPDYLDNLNIFYSNPKNVWGYCHVMFYDPYSEPYTSCHATPKTPEIGWWMLNITKCETSPKDRLDSSQVTFRINALRNKNVQFPFPRTVNLDSVIFEDMYSKYGECKFTHCVGQIKGWSAKQLGVRDRVTKDIYTNSL